jgi:carbonic anhydrase
MGGAIMTGQTLLRQIVEANKSFLAGTPRFLDPAGEPFVVVACIDPRLTGLLEPALGLPRHRAIVIRTAGNQLSQRTHDELRSIAVALYVKSAREIFVVGHTDCGMSTFSVAEVTENFRKAGIPRSAFGDEDLRTWFSAFASIRNNVLGSIEYLRRSGFIACDVKIHGLILETNQGSLEVALDGDLISQGAAPPVMEQEPAKTVPPVGEDVGKEDATVPMLGKTPFPSSPAQAAQKQKKGPIVVGQPAINAKGDTAAATPDSLFAAALVLKNFIYHERQDQRLQKSIADLRTMWRQEKSPTHVFAGLGNIIRAYEADYPNLRGAVLYLENAIKSGSADKIGVTEIMRRFLD